MAVTHKPVIHWQVHNCVCGLHMFCILYACVCLDDLTPCVCECVCDSPRVSYSSTKVSFPFLLHTSPLCYFRAMLAELVVSRGSHNAHTQNNMKTHWECFGRVRGASFMAQFRRADRNTLCYSQSEKISYCVRQWEDLTTKMHQQ